MTYDFDHHINRQQTESEKWNYYDEDVLPMWVADMDFASPEPVIRALHKRVEHGLFGYAIAPPELRELVVERMKRLYNWQIAPEDILFRPGVVTSFNLVCHAVTGVGDGLLTQTPVYRPILQAHVSAGLTPNRMKLTRRLDGYYEIDFDLFEKTISTNKTKLFILCNPHNPVGRVFRPDELEQMAEICLRHNLIICSDEIHSDIILRGNQHLPTASISPEVAAQTVTLLAPSKTFNIPGLKCSIMIVQNKELRKKIEKTHTGLVHGVNIMGYTAALAAYRDSQSWLNELLIYIEDNLDFLMQYVEENLPGISMNRPEGTYLAWLDCREAGIKGSPYKFFLKQAKVALSSGAIFGRGGKGFVRLNFACPRSMLTEGLNRMRDALLLR